MSKTTRPTSVDWQGNLTCLSLEGLLARIDTLAFSIASAVAVELEPDADTVRAFREASDERNRRASTGDWNHEGRVEHRSDLGSGGPLAAG